MQDPNDVPDFNWKKWGKRGGVVALVGLAGFVGAMALHEPTRKKVLASIDPFLCAAHNKKGAEVKKELFQDLRGDVLEIGSGSGANFAFFPQRNFLYTAVDSNEHVVESLKDSANTHGLPDMLINTVTQDVREYLKSAPSGSFDSVVSTVSLTSEDSDSELLSEVYRVLRPGGRFFFVEHTKSEGLGRFFQPVLNPLRRYASVSGHALLFLGEMLLYVCVTFHLIYLCSVISMFHHLHILLQTFLGQEGRLQPRPTSSPARE